DGDGKTTVDFGSAAFGASADRAAGVVMQSAGAAEKIVVVGQANEGLTGDDLAGARFVRDAVRVSGTPGEETISVDQGTQPGTLKVMVNGTVSDNLVGPVLVDGGDGSDTYTVNFGGAAGTGTMMVDDTGTVGSDTLTVNGTAQADTLDKGANF